MTRREQIARIVDGEAFEINFSSHPHPDDLTLFAVFAERQREALAKADQIMGVETAELTALRKFFDALTERERDEALLALKVMGVCQGCLGGTTNREPCTDCLGTGWAYGAAAETIAAEAALAALKAEVVEVVGRVDRLSLVVLSAVHYDQRDHIEEVGDTFRAARNLLAKMKPTDTPSGVTATGGELGPGRAT